MKKSYLFFVLLLATFAGYAQSIQNVYPSDARRNQHVWFTIEGLNTHFSQSSSLTIQLKSNVDGSVITINDVFAGADTYCDAAATIPATATTGSYSVSLITTNEGTLTKASAFAVSNLPPVPELLSVAPSVAKNGDHVALLIKARYASFLAASNLWAYVSGSTTFLTADSLTVINDTTLLAYFDIPVKNRTDLCGISVYSDNENIYLHNCFTINGIDPEIVSITPDSADDGDQVNVIIQTTKTTFTASSYIDITLQGGWAYIPADSVTIVNDSLLVASFDIPERTRTSVCDVVILDDGNGITKMGGFKINGIEPEIVSLSPVEGEQGQTLDVTISGKDMFFSNASGIDVNLYSMTGGVIHGEDIVVLNENQVQTTLHLTAGTPAESYTVEIYVNGSGFFLEDAFTVLDDGIPDPRLVSVTPDVVSRGQVLDVTITGERTHFTQASTIGVYLSGGGFFEPTSTAVLSDTKLKCTFNFPANATMGVYSVYVYEDLDNTPLTLWDALTITGNPSSDPVIVSISPAMTFPGQTLDVTITGARTHFMASTTTIGLYIFSQSTQIMATQFTATSNTSMNARFDIPEDFPLGIYDFGIISEIDGWMTLLQSVIVNAVGLGEENTQDVKLYPNPATDRLYLETQATISSLVILDVTGRQIPVSRDDVTRSANEYMIPLDKMGLKKGIYFVRIVSDSGTSYQKFLIGQD